MTTPDTQDRTPTVIPLDGHLIHSNRKQFKMRVLDVLAAGDKRIVIDCAQAKYIDSAGLGALVSLQRAAYLHRAQIVLASLNDEMTGLLKQTQLDALFAMAPTVGAAITKFGAADV